MGVDSVACCQSPSSMLTSTVFTPIGCAHAIPAMGTLPAETGVPIFGVSTRDDILMGASAE